MRDATFYQRPSARPRFLAVHIATTHDTAACNPGPEFRWGSVLPVGGIWWHDPSEVYDDLRCRRPGCRVHWDKVPSNPREDTP